MNQSNSIEGDLKGFESEESYFVENDGYDLLADVREDLETAFDYSEQPSEKGREYLRRGDQLLVTFDTLAEEPDKRKHFVEAAIDHYRVAASETDDQEYFEEELQSAFRSITAGIDQIEYSRQKPSRTAEEVEELENQLMENLG